MPPSRGGPSPHARPRSAAQRRCRTPSPRLSGCSPPRLRPVDAYRTSLRAMNHRHEELNRAFAFMARVDEGAATEVREWRLGTPPRTPQLPQGLGASPFLVAGP